MTLPSRHFIYLPALRAAHYAMRCRDGGTGERRADTVRLEVFRLG